MSEIVNHYGLGAVRLCTHGLPNLDTRCPYCERDELRAALAQSQERAESLSRELLAAIQARDSYRASAELRVGMRREVGELLGVRDTTGEEAFARGLARLRDLLAAEARLVGAATEALEVLTRLADSAAYWSDYDVPVGIVSEIDAAKARLAGALAREARP